VPATSTQCVCQFHHQGKKFTLVLLPNLLWYSWCPQRDSNPQNSDFESDKYTNSITGADFNALLSMRVFKHTDINALEYSGFLPFQLSPETSHPPGRPHCSPCLRCGQARVAYTHPAINDPAVEPHAAEQLDCVDEHVLIWIRSTVESESKLECVRATIAAVADYAGLCYFLSSISFSKQKPQGVKSWGP
jgi:hypothetical protein